MNGAGWKLLGLLVGLGGVFMGAMVGIYQQDLGISIMLAGAIGGFIFIAMGGRNAVHHKHHHIDDD